ncbi:MAG: substrate-binding domain-containing protein [Spirochaetes bacterium]|nr:substrate-binding domain-containing protein [Spirochaetota bacterium]
MKRVITTCILLSLTAVFLWGCTGDRKKEVIFATTTSTQDTGLLDELIPVFEKAHGYRVKTIAVGSGQAMAMGERGEADLLLVHSKDAEERFIQKGYGVNRRIVMHNDFVILGPKKDPAGIRGMASAPGAFRKIAASKSLFVSRGDKSGTHVKEQKLWQKTGLNPEKQAWYQQTGLGMGQTLSVVTEKQGYTLCDRGTYLSRKKTLDLEILVEGDSGLLNVYHVIEVNPGRFPGVNTAGARAFADFWVDPETQKMIREFGIKKFGDVLFYPDAVK